MPQLLSILHTIFIMGIVLGFMILIHEFGHYAAAKYFGVRVEVFSIGFGKRLIGFRRGETDYRISALPLGGYVKMSGENPMDSRTDDPGVLAKIEKRSRPPRVTHDLNQPRMRPTSTKLTLILILWPTPYNHVHGVRA